MRGIINEYEALSGQKVNFEKSLIYFSGNVGLEIQEHVGNLLGVRISTNPEKYLGLPTMVGRRKKQAFSELKDRFNKLTNNWSVKVLSAGGKEVFIKSILQAIPIYAMQCFKFPISFYHELENIMGKFWWQNFRSQKGIHWCKWEALCVPKADGGLALGICQHLIWLYWRNRDGSFLRSLIVYSHV
ncbi:hypothetical protein J1N35_009720 [Gossypium stocksii]|uniref:Reverse transcriptase n=1 Tax=Gossypium stocksii TaxID=47602 RepID=A0A9D3VZM1_9ROSI|nr:hypothetical protein J1N35_009720 [Gossypium stocksii]